MSKQLILLLVLIALTSTTGSCYKKKPYLGYDHDAASVASQYAACSCVTNEYINNIQSWFYDHCLQAQTKQNMDKDVYVVQSQSKYNLLAYVAHDKKRNWNIVSFRATICGNSMANVRLDLDFLLIRYREHGCERRGCKVHQGFINGYNSLVKNGLLKAIKVVGEKHKDAKWLVTGISLGAALAAIGAYEISQQFQEEGYGKPDMMVYTFGEPRIGNQMLAQTINSDITIYRVVLEKDPVPHMPPRKSFFLNGGYFHPGVEVFYPINGGEKQDITICAGDNDDCTSNKATTTPGFAFEACNHMQYPENRVFAFGRGTITSYCKDNFAMSDAKRPEYRAVLKFAYKLVFDRESIKCPNLQMPEQLKCDQFKAPADASNHLPDFRWLFPDSILQKYEGQMYPSDSNDVNLMKQVFEAVHQEGKEESQKSAEEEL